MNQYKDWSFGENAIENKGVWRGRVFNCDHRTPIDLEIGTGNGFHFASLCHKHPERKIIGLDLKYKTTVQSIRRSLRQGSVNGRMLRFPAQKIKKIFAESEINNVYIHFPDPWPKKRHLKKRLIQKKFVEELFLIMRPGSFLEFKTDDRDYFFRSWNFFKKGLFETSFFTEDLHRSLFFNKNFITSFESLFLKKGQPIYYFLLRKKPFFNS